METVGLFEAKQKLSELVERARAGETIGITRHGKLVARLVTAGARPNWKRIFADIDEYRSHARLPREPAIKTAIEAGRQ